MRGPDSTHHHGPLAGVSAGAAAVLVGGGLILIAARRQLGEVTTVIAWTLMAAVVGAAAAAFVYAFIWLRHRVLHPEMLAGRRAYTAEIADPAAVTLPDAASTPLPYAEPVAAIEPPREIHLHFHAADPAEAAAIIRQALPGTAGSAITERN